MALFLANLLVLGFIFKILSRKPLFTYIKEKHGTETLRQCRGFEKIVIRYEKSLQDLRFLLTCKKEGLIPTFAKPKLSVEGSTRIRKGIAKILIKSELKVKHRIKNELKKEIDRLCQSIRGSVSWMLFNTLRYKVRLIVSVRQRRTKRSWRRYALRVDLHPEETHRLGTLYTISQDIHSRMMNIAYFPIR